MIVMRIDSVHGSCEIPGYDRERESWFPVESIEFGFTKAIERREAKDGGRDIDYGVGEVTELSVDKRVDSATCDLMALAMQDRLKVKSDKPKNLTADIHFLETAGGKAIPYLRITLNNVLIKAWEIEGSEDERPEESLTLWFDRVAMQYQWTTDGLTFSPAGKKGWDQVANQSWSPSTPFFP